MDKPVQAQTVRRTIHRIINGVETEVFEVEIQVQNESDLSINDLIYAIDHQHHYRLPLMDDGDYNTVFEDVPPTGGWL